MGIFNFFTKVFEKSTGSTWVIYERATGIKEAFANFDVFEKRCKELIKEDKETNYSLEYWRGDVMEEQAELLDYFLKEPKNGNK